METSDDVILDPLDQNAFVFTLCLDPQDGDIKLEHLLILTDELIP